MYYYQLYGMNISSQIELCELIPLNNVEKLQQPIEVEIEIGNMKPEIKELLGKGITSGNGKNSIWFSIIDVGGFHIINGNKIIVEPYMNCDYNALKVYLLGRAFASIMLQKQILCLQGGAIDIKGKGIIIMGESCAGKSTLLEALKRKGHKIIADDLASIDLGESIEINPAYPVQRLCKDSVLDIEISDEYPVFNFIKEKCLIPMDLKSFQDKKTRLASIVFLKQGKVENIKFEEVTGGEKIQHLLNTVFRYSVLKDIGIYPAYFKKCVKVAKEIPMYKLTRPEDINTVDAQVTLVESLI